VFLAIDNLEKLNRTSARTLAIINSDVKNEPYLNILVDMMPEILSGVISSGMIWNEFKKRVYNKTGKKELFFKENEYFSMLYNAQGGIDIIFSKKAVSLKGSEGVGDCLLSF